MATVLNLTFHFFQVLWMTAAALSHLFIFLLTSHDRTAAESMTRFNIFRNYRSVNQRSFRGWKHLRRYTQALFLWTRQRGQDQQTQNVGTRPHMSGKTVLVPDEVFKRLPAWIRVADCWQERCLRRRYRRQQHWMVKAH